MILGGSRLLEASTGDGAHAVVGKGTDTAATLRTMPAWPSVKLVLAVLSVYAHAALGIHHFPLFAVSSAVTIPSVGLAAPRSLAGFAVWLMALVVLVACRASMDRGFEGEPALAMAGHDFGATLAARFVARAALPGHACLMLILLSGGAGGGEIGDVGGGTESRPLPSVSQATWGAPGR